MVSRDATFPANSLKLPAVRQVVGELVVLDTSSSYTNSWSPPSSPTWLNGYRLSLKKEASTIKPSLPIWPAKPATDSLNSFAFREHNLPPDHFLRMTARRPCQIEPPSPRSVRPRVHPWSIHRIEAVSGCVRDRLPTRRLLSIRSSLPLSMISPSYSRPGWPLSAISSTRVKLICRPPPPTLSTRSILLALSLRRARCLRWRWLKEKGRWCSWRSSGTRIKREESGSATRRRRNESSHTSNMKSKRPTPNARPAWRVGYVNINGLADDKWDYITKLLHSSLDFLFVAETWYVGHKRRMRDRRVVASTPFPLVPLVKGRRGGGIYLLATESARSTIVAEPRVTDCTVRFEAAGVTVAAVYLLPALPVQ